MFLTFLINFIAAALSLAYLSTFVFAQDRNTSLPPAANATENKYSSQEISDIEGVPVLLLHLPDWQNVRSQAVFVRNREELRATIGDRQIIEYIDFSGGTEAVTAPYAAGKLLIIEYMTPQASSSADIQFTAALAEDAGPTVYRRIGNYNAFVFDVVDRRGAEKLLDQVKYEKTIHWLGDNPFELSAERIFVLVYTDVFISTVFVILIGIGVAILSGSITGIVYYRYRHNEALNRPTYTDAGGMTRLNLDGYTPEIVPIPTDSE